MGRPDMMTMYGVSVLLLPLLSLTVASPILKSDLEVPVQEIEDLKEKGLLLPLLGLYGLYSLYEHLMGSTPPTSEVTTLAPGVTTPGPEVTTPGPGVNHTNARHYNQEVWPLRMVAQQWRIPRLWTVW